MANAGHLDRIRSGSASWNDWRRQDFGTKPDLSGADLSGLDLQCVNLTDADLRGAELHKVKLFGADLQFANLTEARGLKGLRASGARNAVLAYYGRSELTEMALVPDHNDRLKVRDLSGYACTGWDFSGGQLAHFDLSKANLHDCCFAGADMSGSKMHGADLSWSNLENANLSGCLLQDAVMIYCNLRGACLQLADLKRANIRLADLTDADVYKADLRDVVYFWRNAKPDILRCKKYVFIYCTSELAEELKLGPTTQTARQGRSTPAEASESSAHSAGGKLRDDSVHNDMLHAKSLAGYDLSGLALEDFDLARWDLSGATCKGTSFVGANLTGCKFEGATLDEAKFDGADLTGANFGRALLRRTQLCHVKAIGATFTDATLDGANLDGSDFMGASFSGAAMMQASLVAAGFKDAIFLNANLSDAILKAANLTGATLDGANLERAICDEARMEQARMARVIAQGASFNNTVWMGADLQRANFLGALGITAAAIKCTRNYILAKFDEELLIALGVEEPQRHNERIDSNDFSGAHLSAYDLTGADLSATTLQRADLRGAVLNGACLENIHAEEVLLDGASLVNANLKGAILRLANLRGARLDGSDMSGACITGADLRQASLCGVLLHSADVAGALFRDATLESADLANVRGLYCDQLAATNINNAKLPEQLGEFTALDNIEGITINARGLMLAMVLLCSYAVLQVVSLTDADLIANRSILSSPLLDIRTPTLFFCFGCPIILLTVYIWTHFYLQHLWEELALLPAVFQDSRLLYKRVYPWFLNTFVSAHFPILRKDRPLLTHVQIAASVAMTWWMMPATLVMLWARYLTRHDLTGTGAQLVMVAAAVAIAAFLQRLAGETLRGRKRRPLRFYRPSTGQKWIAAAVASGMLILCAYSFCAIRGCPVDPGGSASLPNWMDWISCRMFVRADISAAEISVKKNGWKGDEEALVGGARLAGSDLRRARGTQAFLANAELSGTDLRAADFSGADFRWADLSSAHLEFANLRGADLRGANLHGANLTGTDLRGAKLDGAVDLTAAQLRAAVVTPGIRLP